MKRSFIIVGDNNFWYSTFTAETQDDIDDEIDVVKEGIENNAYQVDNKPTKLYLYEVNETKTFKL